MVELVEKRFDGFMSFLAQDDLIDHVRWHRGVDAIQAQEGRAHGRRRIGTLVTKFHRGDLTGREPQPRPRPEPHRLVLRRVSRAEARLIGYTHFEQPA
ncbi:hypothetical protein OKW35_004171 [Paraburkholderia sp. MM5477-R1]